MTNAPDRVRELEARIDELERSFHRRSRRRRPRGFGLGGRLVAVGVLVATVLSTGIALASHQFSDVPDSHAFHADIGRIADAGITAGCTATTYCPEQGMTRGQMAGFLSRGLGRGARDSGMITFAELTAGSPIAQVTIKTGGVPGGTGFVLATASATIQAVDGACPCDVGIAIKRGASDYSPVSTAVTRTQIVSGWWLGDATVSWLFEAPSGSTQTIQLVPNGISWLGDPDGSFAKGMITAVYVPFGPDGGSTLPADVAPQLPPATVPDP